jgi:hypothetical protein
MFSLNISFPPTLFFHYFLSSKYQKMKFLKKIPLFLIFNFFSYNFSFFLNPIDYICSYPCNSLGFGLYFSNLHINVYHVFDVDFE